MNGLKSVARNIASRMGYQVYKIEGARTPLVYDMDPGFAEIHALARPFSSQSMAKMYAIYQAIQYIVKHDIPGDIVECGVLRGGSSMIAALTLAKLGDTKRTLWLYDTYQGMSEPDDRDIRVFDGMMAHTKWSEDQRGDHNSWAYASLESVKSNLYSTGYPQEHLKFIAGKVEETIPGQLPDQVAVLRLDTVWYESTYHELNHIYPLVSLHGLVLFDDYGYWKGFREATDKYIQEHDLRLHLGRIDPNCRIAIKPQP